jgi:hypothetical protein
MTHDRDPDETPESQRPTPVPEPPPVPSIPPTAERLLGILRWWRAKT